jgi:phosphomannomutase/phosphoglucomutase
LQSCCPPQEIFRAYDIRGLVGEEITPAVVEVIARTYAARFLGPQARVVLGRDARESSAELAEAAKAGLVAAGAEVWDVGLVPTPLAYFVMGRWGASGGIVITASHNPPQYNGMKLRLRDQPFYGQQLQELWRATLEPPAAQSGGRVIERDAYAEYFDTAARYVTLARPFKLVLDVGNGAAALTAPQLLERVGCELEVLFGELDGGQFSGRGPNPTQKGALEPLAQRVRQVGAEMGVAIDADGDRLVVVDESGAPVAPDHAAIPICRDLLARQPEVIVSEVRCSRSTIEDVQAHGGTLEMRPCGYPFILAGMRERQGAFGFEKTGHYYFRNPDIKFDDATFATAMLVATLTRGRETLGQILASAPVYYASDEVRWACPDELKFRVVEEVARAYAREHQVITIDGVRVELPEGWGLVRASNTAAELVMVWEGKTPAARDALGASLCARVREVMEQLGVAGEAG